MAFVQYTGLNTPNAILGKMVEYITSLGYTIAQPLVDDLNIYQMDSTDGKKFVFMDKTNEYFICLRSANGTQIFGTNDDAAMDIATPDTNPNYTGIGMVVSEGYSRTQRWYNQYNVPIKKVADTGGNQVLGVYMPINTNYTYTLICNNVPQPTDTIVFTIVKENDTYRQCAHLAYANINKYDSWNGGAMFTGSSIKSLMGNDIKCFNHTQLADQYILPIFSSGTVSNTFLRADIDEAPTEARGNIIWASSGTANETGKKLSLPIRTGNNMNGQIPHYWWLQSKSRLDGGRNVNTLNAISIDMPIYAAVIVDPDVLNNYAAVGDVSGVYFVSTLNMQTGYVYETQYPTSGKLNQVFPACGKRRGQYGFDGISIAQFTEESDT